MKHIRISLIVALIIGAMAAVSSVSAAEGADNKAKTEAPAGKQRMTAEQRLDRTAERLGLNAEQKTKLKTASEAQNKAVAELRKDASLCPKRKSRPRPKSSATSSMNRSKRS